jgi:hypothetical protein
VQPALFGRAGGDVSNVILNSGTNQIHGNLNGFSRVSASDATQDLAKRKSTETFNQFGFTLGGPIIHNRTFFFVTFKALTIIAETLRLLPFQLWLCEMVISRYRRRPSMIHPLVIRMEQGG